jgi:peroxiredoxin
MRRISIPLLLIAALAATAVGQEADKTKPARRERALRPTTERRGAEQGQIAQRLQKQIDELRTAHQDLIADLRTLRATATKEKATETAAQIDKVISKHEQSFQEKVQQLELQQQQMQKALKERAGNVEEIKKQGRGARDFEASSFDGKTVKLADYKDKIVVLEWLNLDCPFVQYHYDKAATMIDLAKKYKDKGVVWLAVNTTGQTTPEANRDFAAKHKLPYPILDDRSGKMGRMYGALTTPHVFIIKNGVVVYDGAIDNAPNGQAIGGEKINYVDKALSELTLGKPVSTSKTQPYGCSVKYPAQ